MSSEELEEVVVDDVAANPVSAEAGGEAADSVTDAGETEAAVAAEDASPDQDPGPQVGEEEVPHGAPRQGEMPFAMVEGKAFTDLPADLYIPPDALEVILEAFEGPLDLLLYLIRRQNLDILEINVADITRQYMTYVDMMTAIRFELAAEYLVMAAMLAEIKSRMLLPRPPEAEEEEGEDPRAALIRRLQEYERFKTAAEDMDELPRMGRDVHQASATGPDRKLTRPDPEVDLKEVLVALADVLRRADMFESHQVEREKLSTRERMTQVLDRIRHRQFVPFVSLFRAEEGRLGVVVTFLAVMELVKESLVELVQNEAFGPIHVRARSEAREQSEGETVEDEMSERAVADDEHDDSEAWDEAEAIHLETDALSQDPEDGSAMQGDDLFTEPEEVAEIQEPAIDADRSDDAGTEEVSKEQGERMQNGAREPEQEFITVDAEDSPALS